MKADEKEAVKNYSLSARAYHAWRTKRHPEGWFFNELLEMPAMLDLLGDVKGKSLLDFGCGSGIYAKIFAKNGAMYKGFDISKEMLEIAKLENSDLDFRLGSGYDIPFKGKFDIVVASLVVHYLEDWDKMFTEVSRVLKKGGCFVFSTGNPVAEAKKKIIVDDEKINVLDGYFNEGNISHPWEDDQGNKFRMCFHHKTYETIIKMIVKNGFEIVDYKDCFPVAKAKRLFPELYATYSMKPMFCIWKVRKK